MSNLNYWEKKLAAFLHDPPEKALDIVKHEDAASRHQTAAGLVDGEHRKSLADSVKSCDIFDAAAERFGFPKDECTHDFASEPLFIHPLSNVSYDAFPGSFDESAKKRCMDRIQTTLPVLDEESELDDRSRFFIIWRRWQENAIDNRNAGNPYLSFFPADSRIPDHSIWSHMAMSSALVDCVSGDRGKMDLILFQFGPVQEFIAQARSTRDLWSGSYLLSWLSAHAMKAVTDEVGPDAMIFPSLRGNGIFDALHRETVYAQKWKSGDEKFETTWKRLQDEKGDKLMDWLLNPTLPNRFFAIVPSGKGEELAKKAATALRDELKNIAESVWTWIETKADDGERSKTDIENWKLRFFTQVKTFPQITWAVQPWLRPEEIRKEARKVSSETVDQIEALITLAESDRIKHDSRYYDGNGKLKNEGIWWSAHYLLLSAKLAARRNTRDFLQWDPVGSAAVKDSLSGKEECIGDEGFWKDLTEADNTKKFFPVATHRYGAMNLIKRLWCVPQDDAYLLRRLGISEKAFCRAMRFSDIQDLAQCGDGKYYAVLALDGDEMGKWISGNLLSPLMEHLASKAKAYLVDIIGNSKRLLTPSYHLQFSEALSVFSINKPREIVERHNGMLVYAGGDDVLAFVPSTEAIACARELREAFRIDFENGNLYPGSKCDMSCGIAIGHCKAPLQMLVKEAQRMESVAKHQYGRAALAITLYKRSGEIIEWGCKWESCAL
ncbi:MAG: type III-B CRISPR-associated protein Cas10/Cmr2, partial [Kiritimatiellae bacterium]|nr:type III-B CRISPR-associated protein Cas10/Cmr2 [Kiritimatiellia bacterium]